MNIRVDQQPKKKIKIIKNVKKKFHHQLDNEYEF